MKMPAAINGTRRELSAREWQVMDLLIQGCYYREISQRLEISYATVHTHIQHIYRKYQVRSRGQAVAKFLMQSSMAGNL